MFTAKCTIFIELMSNILMVFAQRILILSNYYIKNI